MYFDKRTLYIIMAIMVLWGLSSYLTNVNALLGLLYTIPGVLIAITFHEFAHAKVADMLGDDTPRREGRLTLNPLKHIEPVGFIMLVFAKFGWGRPVQINPSRFKKNISVSKGEAIVSFAGPLMNIILAFVSAFILGIMIKFNLFSNMKLIYAELITVFFMQLICVNIGLGVFNLIPLPPLDGSKILRHFLPRSAQVWFDNNQYIFYIVFIAIWVLGIASIIISPVINLIIKGILTIVSYALGINI